MTDITDQTDEQSKHLGGNQFSDPASPLTVRIRFERWVGDYAQEVGSVEFDGRAVFDAEPLSTIANDMSDLDWVLHSATAAGLVDEHDGPFTVEVPEDLAEYIEHRENAGMIEAYPSAADSLAAARAEHLNAKLEGAIAEVKRLREALGVTGGEQCSCRAASSEPHDAPSDAEVLAGLNAENPRAATDDLSDWGDWSINRMRAALSAAGRVRAAARATGR